MACRLDADALLTLWERTIGGDAVAVDEALLHAGFDSGSIAAPRTLGERNARLLALHAQWFGAELVLLSHCPACGTAAQFSADAQALAASAPASDATLASHHLAVDGHAIEFRLPDHADIAAAAGAPDDEGFVDALLSRCILDCRIGGIPLRPQELPATVLDALSMRMETLDPAASLSFALDCPQCATRWDARLDPGQPVRQKVQAAAERLLLDVNALARSYGWSEGEVLRLSPTRRAAYLQLAAA